MFIEVNRIPPDGLEIDRALELESIPVGGESVPVEKVRLSGGFQRSRGDVVFRGRVEAVLTLVCSRCAAPVFIPISEACYRVYRPGALGRPATEEGADEEDLALTPFDGVRIDLNELAREEIYLLAPLKPLCRETCAGLCPRCGANRNLEPCGCPQDLDPTEPLTLKIPL